MAHRPRNGRVLTGRRRFLTGTGVTLVGLGLLRQPARSAVTLGFTLMSGFYRVKVQPLPERHSVECLVQELTMTDWDPVPGARVQVRRNWDDEEVDEEVSDHEGRTLHSRLDYYPGDTIYVAVPGYIPSGRGTL